MRKRWISYLLAMFALLWAKLPGPRPQKEPKPSSKFYVRDRGGIVEISTKAATLPWLSEQTAGITVQRVKPQSGEQYTAKEAPLRSRMKVRMASPDAAELHDLGSEVRGRLLSGTGHYAIVTGGVEEGRFDKQAEMIVEGQGRGTWRILRRK